MKNLVSERILRPFSLQFTSDLTMVAPTIRMAIFMQRAQKAVYLYKINHRSPYTKPDWWGCYHSLELDYLFGSPFSGYSIARDSLEKPKEEDQEFSRQLMLLWTNFAKFGYGWRENWLMLIESESVLVHAAICKPVLNFDFWHSQRMGAIPFFFLQGSRRVVETIWLNTS